jgi:hypothetical protein
MVVVAMLLTAVFGAAASADGEAGIRRLLAENTPLSDMFSSELKCGTTMLFSIAEHRDDLSAAQIRELDLLMQPPALEQYVVSPKGYFRIHFDTSAASVHSPSPVDLSGNGIPDYIDSVAAIFDHVWESHTDDLGFEPPFLDPGESYPVYVINMRETRGPAYGVTVPTQPVPGTLSPPRYKSYILIDHAYEGFATSGLDGLRVTAAHEFQHAVQFGAYGSWLGTESAAPARFFYEITATWMEDVLYPDINDYYNYLPALFNEHLHASPFHSGVGTQMYARAIWGHFMEARFGRDMMRTIWENIRTAAPLAAMDRVLRDRGAMLETELAEYHLWKFYTGTRAEADVFFLDAAAYPTLPTKTPVIAHFGESMFSGAGTQTVPLHPQTLHFHGLATASGDTVYFLVSNVHPRPGDRDNSYELRVYSHDAPNSIPVGNGLYYRMDGGDASRWKVVPVYRRLPVADGAIAVFPNPFNARRIPTVAFVVGSDEEVQLSVFGTDMRLAYRGHLAPGRDSTGRYLIRWDGRDGSGRQLASGIYIYVIAQGARALRGKITIIRD